jgi:hypothetical protein
LVLLYANNEEGLINKAATVQQIYNFNYSFAQAPTVPFADGSPYNQRVVIYWDNTAEDSFDRLFGRRYRATPNPVLISRVIASIVPLHRRLHRILPTPLAKRSLSVRSLSLISRMRFLVSPKTTLKVFVLTSVMTAAWRIPMKMSD